MNLKKQPLYFCLLWLLSLPMVSLANPFKATSDTLRAKRGTKSMQFGSTPQALPNSVKVVTSEYRSFPELEDFVNQAQWQKQVKSGLSSNNITAQSDILHIPMQQSLVEFTDEYIKSIYTVPALIAATKDTAKSVFKLLEQTDNFIDKLAPAALVELPVGLKKRVGNTMFMIGISQAKYYKDYSELTIFCKMTVPQGAGKPDMDIFFGADNVRFTHRGNLVGTPKLVLLGDVNFPINGGSSLFTLKGGMNMQTGNVDSLTFVKFNCSGVEQIGITAEVSFSRNLLVPLNASLDTSSNPTEKVKGSFRSVANDWNDIVANISLPPFAIKGLESVGIVVSNAVFDFSDYSTPDSVKFPAAYKDMLPPDPRLWRGVYLSNVRVHLPKEFKIKGSQSRVNFAADSLLIDNLGFTGRISANNVFQNGTASKWDFSVDKFEIELLTNNLRSAGFYGSIALPLSKKPDTATQVASYGLGYKAIFSTNNSYLMQVSIKNEIAFDVWKAKAKLSPGSFIELWSNNNQFQAKALLNGSLGISTYTASNKQEASFKGIVFQNLLLQTISPRCSIGYLGYVNNDTNKLVSFPLSISSMRGYTDGELLKLDMTFGINFMDGNNRFAANSSLTFSGRLVEQGDYYTYDYADLQVNSISLDANFNKFSIKGFVNIHRNHPIMGTGFEGGVKMKMDIGKQPVEIQSNLAFGRTAYRYWYVDALATGFRIELGFGVAITGLGGGAWQNMKRGEHDVNTTALPTGIGYIPNDKFRFGFRAMTKFIVGSKEAVDGRLMFEMTFTESMGIEKVILTGNLNALTSKLGIDASVSAIKDKIRNSFSSVTNSIKDDHTRDTKIRNQTARQIADAGENTTNPNESQGSIHLKVGIEYNVTANTFDANFSVNLNIANGTITGRGDNYMAGEGRLYIAPDKWYLHLGKPSNPMGVAINISNIARVETGAYFMVGTELEPMGDVPGNVLSILGPSVNQTLTANRNFTSLSTGKGLALGSSLSLNIPEITISPLYARFNAGVGFDVMVNDFGNVSCVGNNNGQIGANGWYSSGRAYAYLEGELGIEVNLWLYRGRFPIIQAGAAALMQAQLPNPTWFVGHVGGYYRLLGGMVQGSFNFKVNFGEMCTLQNQNQNPNPMEFITDIVPDNNSEDIDPLAVPQAVFRMPLDRNFELELIPGQPKTYRTTLQQFTLTANGMPLAGQIVRSSSNTAAFFETTDVMPENTSIKGKVTVSFEIYENGSWSPYYYNNAPLTETKEIVFKTGGAHSKIPLTNIAYTYPVINQKYFFVAENNTGVIKLKRNLTNIINTNTNLSLRFTDQYGIQINQNATYDFTQKEIRFTVPSLSLSSTYQVDVFVTEQTAGAVNIALDYNNVETEEVIEGSDDFSMISSTNRASSLLVRAAPSLATNNSVLSFNFGTSQYSTFSAKMDAKQPQINILTMEDILEVQCHYSEPFDLVDLIGNAYSASKPLIRYTNLLNETHSIKMNYLLYEWWDPSNENLLGRVIEEVGAPPNRAISVISSYCEYLNNNTNTTFLNTKFPFKYSSLKYFHNDLDIIFQTELARYYTDWDPFRNRSYYNSTFFDRAKNYYGSNFIQRLQNGISSPTGLYKTNFEYVMPNRMVTSNYIYNFIK